MLNLEMSISGPRQSFHRRVNVFINSFSVPILSRVTYPARPHPIFSNAFISTAAVYPRLPNIPGGALGSIQLIVPASLLMVDVLLPPRSAPSSD
jgi:hypothetical protein